MIGIVQGIIEMWRLVYARLTCSRDTGMSVRVRCGDVAGTIEHKLSRNGCAMKRTLLSIAIRIRWIIATFPATIIILSLILIIAYLTSGSSTQSHRVLIDDVGLDLDKVINWQFWTLPASTVIQAEPGIGPKLAMLVVVALASLEYLVGSVRAAVTFFLSDWISAPLTILVAWPVAHLGIDRAYNVLYRADTGSSAAALGALAAVLVFLPARWRLAAFSVLFTILICLLPTAGLSANIAHLLGASAGAVFGLIWKRYAHTRELSVRRLPRLVVAARALLRGLHST